MDTLDSAPPSDAGLHHWRAAHVTGGIIAKAYPLGIRNRCYLRTGAVVQ